MSWWNAKYKNNHGEYEITFASKYYEKAKAVEKVCQAIIDKVIESPEDVAPVVHGRWKREPPIVLGGVTWDYCSVCGSSQGVKWMKYCPNCGARMDGE